MLILGQYQMAIEDFNKAIILKEDYATAYNDRAFLYLKLGDNIQWLQRCSKSL